LIHFYKREMWSSFLECDSSFARLQNELEATIDVVISE